MSTMVQTRVSEGLFGFLNRDRTIANQGFSRWMVPPAALVSAVPQSTPTPSQVEMSVGQTHWPMWRGHRA